MCSGRIKGRATRTEGVGLGDMVRQLAVFGPAPDAGAAPTENNATVSDMMSPYTTSMNQNRRVSGGGSGARSGGGISGIGGGSGLNL